MDYLNDTYAIIDGTLLSYSGDASVLNLFGHLGDIELVRIGDGAFMSNSELTKIVIPDGVKSIGAQAFNGCSGLKSLTIPSTVTEIGALAFCSIGLAEIRIRGLKLTSSEYSKLKNESMPVIGSTFAAYRVPDIGIVQVIPDRSRAKAASYLPPGTVSLLRSRRLPSKTEGDHPGDKYAGIFFGSMDNARYEYDGVRRIISEKVPCSGKRSRTVSILGRQVKAKSYICSPDGVHYRDKPDDLRLQLAGSPQTFCPADCPFCIATGTKEHSRLDIVRETRAEKIQGILHESDKRL